MLLPGECEVRRKRRAKAVEVQLRWRKANPEAYRNVLLRRKAKPSALRRTAYAKIRAAAAARRRRKQNPQLAREAAKKWRLANPTKSSEYANAWRKRNLKKVAQVTRLRRSSDVGYRLRNTVYGRVYAGLTGKLKSSRTEDLLGCSFTFLRFWLESKFLPNMSWENYGDWHVDHIRPLASFDLTDPKQQALAFHFLNLQPLWAKDNLSKGAKILDTCGPSDKGVCATVESHGQLLERAALESL
jgi:hypothetical protein